MSEVTRRDFVKGAAASAVVVAGAGLLANCTSASPAETGLPEQWDEEADVVIAGAGGTGLSAAIEARDAGASVIVLEKAPLVGGTTKLSGGVIQAAGTSFQRDVGVQNDTPAAHRQYWVEAAEGIADPALVKSLADGAPLNIEWLVEQGVMFVTVYGVDTIPYIDPALMVDRIHVPAGAGTIAVAGTGRFVTEPLYNVAQDKGAEFLLETTAKSLFTTSENGVVGILASRNNRDLNVKAKKGVVIATSGFDHNEEMARAFSPQQLWALQTGFVGSAPTDTGDGIRMAMEIGANLSGLGGTIGFPGTVIGTLAAFPGIWVNKYGQRFVNENAHYAYIMRAVFDQEEHIAWAVLDSKVEGWTADIEADIASGAVKTSNTIMGLADATGVNASQLQATIDKWNQDAASGADSVFLKQVGLEKIDTPPYYALMVTEYNLGSCGGLKINTNSQVIDVFDQPIPRLYAGGMAAGGIIGPYYPGSGTAVGMTIHFGRIAGRNAAGLESWE